MMNLHRASAKPDWDHIPLAKQNGVQRLAAATHGVVTPANVITAAGLAMVVYGLWLIVNSSYIVGTVLLVIGRLLDIVDGVVAEATKTKSALGETCDAVADKVGTVLTVAVLLVVDGVSWWAVVGLVLPQVIIPIIIAHKRRRRIRVHPTRAGKLSMAIAWVAIVGLLIGAGLDGLSVLHVGTYVCVAISLALGLWAAGQYAGWTSAKSALS